MKFGEPKTIRLKAVTPLFIGNGETLKPLSYLLDGNVVHVLDEGKFFAQLSPQEQERYLNWVDPLLDRLARLEEEIAQARDDFERRRQLQRQRREIEGELSVQHFLANVLRTRPLAFVSRCEAYAIRCNTPPERDGFRLQLKDVANRPYIPGTGIKGALRTALLYALVAEPRHYPWLRDRLGRFRSDLRSGLHVREKVRRLEKIAGDLEAKLLRGEVAGETKDDAKFDFLRFMEVSDSTPLLPDALRIELTQMLGTGRYTRTWVETIAPGSEVTAQIALGDPMLILRELGLERLREWLSLSKLLEACYIHSHDILDEEAKYFAGEPRLAALVTQLQRENEPNAPLLRLGQGQGFLGVTVDLAVKRRDEQLYDEAIREGVSLQRRWRTTKDRFPKTRRVVTDRDGTPLSLLGWAKAVLF
jgi:CRISPR-associated protein Csm5